MKHKRSWTLGALGAGLALAVLTVAVSVGADERASVTFEDRPTRYWVEIGGVKASSHESEDDARSAAADAKTATPDAFVTYSEETVYVVGLDSAPVVVAPTTDADPPGPGSDQPPAPAPEPEPESSQPDSEPDSQPDSQPDSEPADSSVPTPTSDGLVWGFDDTVPDDGWSRPAVFEPYLDPAYGTTTARVSSADGTRFNRNTYSRRQAENADGSSFLTYHGDGAYHVYDAANGELVRALTISADSWPQWHPTEPNLIRHTADDNSYGGDLALYELDVTTGTSSVLADLTARIQKTLPGADYMHDKAEGSPSIDGDRWAWMVYDEQEDVIGVASYDLGSDSLAVIPRSALPDSSTIDWVSASPSGDSVVAGHWDGTWVLDFDLTDPRLLFAGGEHSDLAIDADGRDTYVYIDFTAGPNGGWLMAVDLETLDETRIFDLYDDANTSIHISGKGYGKPGWVVASTYNCKEPGAWSCGKVLAVELAPQGRVLNLAHTYNCGEEYWTETHAVVNRDFTKVYYNSDAGSCGIDAEVYRLDVPPFS